MALGGGSVIDASKAIGLMAANGGDLWDYVIFGTGKKQWPQKPGLPIVAIPTTAGTGSETDGGAVITNPETNEKTGVFGPGHLPGAGHCRPGTDDQCAAPVQGIPGL